MLPNMQDNNWDVAQPVPAEDDHVVPDSMVAEPDPDITSVSDEYAHVERLEQELSDNREGHKDAYLISAR
jgi:hypothetical protein